MALHLEQLNPNWEVQGSNFKCATHVVEEMIMSLVLWFHNPQKIKVFVVVTKWHHKYQLSIIMTTKKILQN